MVRAKGFLLHDLFVAVLSGVDEGEGKRSPAGQSDFILISQLESSREPLAARPDNLKEVKRKGIKIAGAGEGARNKERREREVETGGF